ncbi:hypothetical protein MRY87_06060, partial [bacterium]|nr:hypothetical protein [bacterium]
MTDTTPTQNGSFQTESGIPVPGSSLVALQRGIEELSTHYSLSREVLLEGPAYSFAMVTRFALGLSATGGKCCGIIRDSFCGGIVINCLRHLVNGGSDAGILVLGSADSHHHIAGALQSAQAYGIPIEYWEKKEQTAAVQELLSDCHNVLFGTADIDLPTSSNPTSSKGDAEGDEMLNEAVQTLNEMSIPVHTVLAPSGFDLHTGERTGELLFASSTLSLGSPLAPLEKYPDLIGRHYLCDLSLPLTYYH